jgi:hypothetical protein
LLDQTDQTVWLICLWDFSYLDQSKIKTWNESQVSLNYTKVISFQPFKKEIFSIFLVYIATQYALLLGKTTI